MDYILKQFDIPLLRFSATTDTAEPEIEILWYDASQVDKLPLDLELTPESLSKWLRHRTIPKNRASQTTVALLSRYSISSVA